MVSVVHCFGVQKLFCVTYNLSQRGVEGDHYNDGKQIECGRDNDEKLLVLWESHLYYHICNDKQVNEKFDKIKCFDIIVSLALYLWSLKHEIKWNQNCDLQISNSVHEMLNPVHANCKKK